MAKKKSSRSSAGARAKITSGIGRVLSPTASAGKTTAPATTAVKTAPQPK